MVALERNLGFAGACNAGIRAGSAEIVILVNNDVDAEPELVERLTAAFDDERDRKRLSPAAQTRRARRRLRDLRRPDDGRVRPVQRRDRRRGAGERPRHPASRSVRRRGGVPALRPRRRRTTRRRHRDVRGRARPRTPAERRRLALRPRRRGQGNAPRRRDVGTRLRLAAPQGRVRSRLPAARLRRPARALRHPRPHHRGDRLRRRSAPLPRHRLDDGTAGGVARGRIERSAGRGRSPVSIYSIGFAESLRLRVGDRRA